MALKVTFNWHFASSLSPPQIIYVTFNCSTDKWIHKTARHCKSVKTGTIILKPSVSLSHVCIHTFLMCYWTLRKFVIFTIVKTRVRVIYNVHKNIVQNRCYITWFFITYAVFRSVNAPYMYCCEPVRHE